MFAFLNITSLSLSILSWLCLLFAKPDKAPRIAFAALLSINLFLLIVYNICDRLSGNGINDAVLYHFSASLQGAGYADFTYEIVLTLTLAAASLAMATLSIFSGGRLRRAPSLRIRYPILLVGGAILINPTIADLAYAWKRTHQTSTNFHQYYTPPYIHARDESRNLVYIYAESFEHTYFDTTLFPDLTPQLRELEKEAVSFTHIRSTAGTTWTIAGLVGSMSGVPLITYSDGNSMSGVDEFLPGAPGLGNLLKRVGYRLEFMGGADIRFSGKNRYLKTQGFDSIQGLQEIVKAHADTPFEQTPWGLYDENLLDLAYKRFEELSQSAQPFGLFLLTLDTHHPSGHLSPNYASVRYQDGSNAMLNAIKASDALLARFIQRLRHSPYAQKTTIVLASDHLALPNEAYSTLERGDRRDTFMVFRPDMPGSTWDTPGSTLDIGSTVLPFLGYTGQIGLGRDLRSNTTTADTLAYIQKAVDEYAWAQDILSLWEFPNLEKGLSVSAQDLCISIRDRRFQLPCLIRTGRELKTIVKMKPNNHLDFDPDEKLAEEAKGIPPGEAYILAMRGAELASLQPGLVADAWYVLCGNAQGVRTLSALDHDIVVGKNEIIELVNGSKPRTAQQLAAH